jgi:type III restriction enzyme
VKHSLGNVLRLVRPLVVIDEGHKAYSNTAFDTIAGYNPRFILELSATPNSGKEYVSNVLVNVAGTALKDEQMIKLPINLINESPADWKHTLSRQRRKNSTNCGKTPGRSSNNEGRYIRLFMLVRVERTGKDQRDKGAIHAEEVREYLLEKIGAKPEEIKVRSSELDELARRWICSRSMCPVRYVITKDALREGWDCSFAYVLAVLSKDDSPDGLDSNGGTHLAPAGGDVETSVPRVNECYVYTFDQDVQVAVESVRRGLEEEGMGEPGRQRANGREVARRWLLTVKRFIGGKNLRG